ncbi:MULTISPECIES: pilus assembly protein TadG-related protein [Pseudomonas]|uniref:pilus assembly protein TadG-related protein n=1 Tax=Pseudomonas nitroreducens TaxID=46680 RepID=UPI001E4F8316|nr:MULTISPECIES: pilus assembly protein TadG-related protein [Pseudomonas]MCE4071593.1 pilus assembly protein TadG-related protein [Pseudomonas nitritireducens]MCE4081369.1 pilus assembly protein TadG-related protein [Pseudomonas nitroreducens]
MGRERQRGAIGVMAAGTLLLALICLALVIDTGRLYYEQRKLQRVVDMAALEAASLSGLCGLPSGVQGYVTTSAARNGFVPATGDSLLATLGSVTFDGGYGSASSRRTFTAGGDPADSVRVQSTHTVPSSLLLNVASLFSGASSNTILSAQAVARRTAMAGISAGSGVLSLDSTNSPLLNALLGGLLGTSINLDLVTYQGIAGANVSLLALSQQLKAAGVNLELGKVDSLLGANVTAAQLLQAMVNAADASQLANVNTSLLRTALATINVPTANLTLGQILSVVAPDSVRDTALNAGVNLLDLLMATALVANKNNAVDLDLKGKNIAGVVPTVKLQVISPPTIAIGYPGKDSAGNWRTVAKNAQVQLVVGANANLLGLNLVKLALSLKVGVAEGYAALDSIQCGGVGQSAIVNVKARPGVASANIDANVSLLSGASGSLLGVTITNTATGASGSSASAGTQFAIPGEQSLSFTVNGPSDLPSAVTRVQSPLGSSLGAGLASLGNSLSIKVTAGGNCNAIILVSWLLCALSSIVNSLADLMLNLTSGLGTLVSALGQQLIDPLLSLLGIQTGILDVRLIDLQTGGAELLI